ncbi:hypothetical protein Mgra_00000816 [Meloidogyne graminicola]|uniref:Caveolin n=1 Tax=Meloidogyne graminicola TaxID=189291 RepID=A0A8T0A3E4_9BILA|nr:hypothetical protein Mgra_00000816 [Meloidogyne graminicola]
MTSVEMQEQTIPLKSAENPQAEGGAESAAGAQQNTTDGATPLTEKKEKKGGGWFSKKEFLCKATNAKTAETSVTGQEGEKKGAEGGEDIGGTDGANNINEKKQKTKGTSGKKCPFSFCRPQRGVATTDETNAGDQQPCFQLNMVQRDDRKLHEGIDLGFEQIFGEPDAVHSINGVWRTTITVFLAVRNFIYKLFSLIFAVPLAIVFGILFALFSVLGVYLFVPIGRLLSIPLGWLAKVWSSIVGAILDPICRSFGLIFGNVKVSRYGINQDPTANF